MYIFLFFVLILGICFYLIFVKPLKVSFLLDSNEMELHTLVLWKPVFMVKVRMVCSKPHITIYCFNLQVLSKIKQKRKNRKNQTIDIFRALDLKDTEVKLFYGISDPFITGILFTALAMINTMTKIETFEQFPSFCPNQDYLRLEGKTNINIGKTIINFVRLKSKKQGVNEKMIEQSDLTGNVDSLFHSLENFTQKEGLIGKPVTQGNKTFLPVVSISVGYGGGNASLGKSQQGNNSSMGGGTAEPGTNALGLGAKLCTDAIIVIDNQNVSMLPINSSASSLADKIPQIVSSMGQNKQSGQSNQNQSQSQNQSIT